MTAPLNRENKDLLAAEHAMGLTSGSDAEQAERLLRHDRAFAQLHAAWTERLAPLDATAPPQETGEALWGRIASALGQPQRAAAPDIPLIERLGAMWRSLSFWRPAGLIAAAASLALAVSLGLFMQKAAQRPVLVAVLMTDDNQPGAVVNVSADGRAELIPLGAIPVPPGRALQIWTLWDRVRGPVSVGLAKSAQRLDLDIKALPRTSPSQLFEITLEPETGSPTGRPTGPILMKGNATTAL